MSESVSQSVTKGVIKKLHFKKGKKRRGRTRSFDDEEYNSLSEEEENDVSPREKMWANQNGNWKQYDEDTEDGTINPKGERSLLDGPGKRLGKRQVHLINIHTGLLW